MLAADLDADGDQDLVVVGLLAPALRVIEQTSAGLVALPPLDLPSGALAVAAADLDGDDRLDLVITAPATASLQILLGAPGPTFTPGAALPLTDPYAVVAGDLDEDGHADLLACGYTGGTASVFLGRGDGSFEIGPALVAPDGCSTLLLADLDGDGHLDLVAAGTAAGEVWRYAGRGEPESLTPGAALPVGRWPSALIAAQLDDDPGLELLGTANLGNQLFVIDGDAVTSLPVGQGPIALAAGDVDGDGALDVLVTYKLENTLAVFGSALPGVPGPPARELFRLPTGDGPTPCAIVDLDGLGGLDLAVADGFSSDVMLYLAR